MATTGTVAAVLPLVTANGVEQAWATGAAILPTPTASAVGTFAESIIAAPVASVITYKAVLSAPGFADYTLAVSSFEMRLRDSPKQCYLSVVVPAILTHADAISDRADGELALYQVLDGVETELLTANVESVRQYVGGQSRSGSITAYKQITFGPAKTRALEDVTYKYAGDGVTRYRTGPRELFPGDTASVGTDYVVVTEVIWSVGASRSVMELTNG